MHSFKKLMATVAMAMAVFIPSFAQNPYLPLWEHIPDGEPYVFEDPDCPGKQRVYIYGSHDSLIEWYCGRELVVWSAPVDDLSNWRYDGIIFQSTHGRDGRPLNYDYKADVLYAPDIATVKEADGTTTYYLYPNNQNGGRQNMVCKSKRPDGPFEVCNWSSEKPNETVGCFAFDPACFVDDDGRVYGYWGFGNVHAAELDPNTMASIKPGTEEIVDMINGMDQEGVFKFFEASSIRKIKDKYVFIYSRMMPAEEGGLPYRSNYTLAYCYSDNPLGPWTYGGTLIDGRAIEPDENGKLTYKAYPSGNTHGSICEINGKWWVFYHRQTGTNEFSRQATVAPIEVKVQEGKGGKVEISQGEFNSMGFKTEGLNPYDKTPAGWACYFTGPEGAYGDFPNFHFSGPYIKASYFDPKSYEGPFNQKIAFAPMVNNTAGSTFGYRYFNFDEVAGKKGVELVCDIVPEGVEGDVTILVGSPYLSKGAVKVGGFKVGKENAGQMTQVKTDIKIPANLKGKQGLYFVFDSPEKGKSICEVHSFQFK